VSVWRRDPIAAVRGWANNLTPSHPVHVAGFPGIDSETGETPNTTPPSFSDPSISRKLNRSHKASGHDFSRADRRPQKTLGFSPCVLLLSVAYKIAGAKARHYLNLFRHD